MAGIPAEWLRRLGAGDSIDTVCREARWTRAEFDTRWQEELRERTPDLAGEVRGAVGNSVEIGRDRWGIPHLFASDARDLWLAFGYVIAQDRLFQLDYLRRKGHGRLAEILGKPGLASDLVARTVGLNRLAQAELATLPRETRELLDSYAAGINLWIEQVGERLPIEFALLGYRPEPWSAVDSLAIETEFRWYLTGRFPVIVMPELAKRFLGEEPQYRDFILGEEDSEAIVPPEAYRDLRLQLGVDVFAGLRDRPCEEVGQAAGDPEATGSNNWVVAGRHCRSGAPMVASDPHIAFEAVSCWYTAHLSGGGFDVCGTSYVGIPAIMIGRNRRLAWGITNNICSQRDLYAEKTDPAHPGCFWFDGRWEPVRQLSETIQVAGEAPVTKSIRFSRNGPIVDEILPPPGNETGPVALKWLGAYHGGWLTALLGIDRAGSVREFREALRPWHVPTFNLVVADVEGHIAVQTTGRIPVRGRAERGYRRGWDPADQWLGLLPFEAMPHAVDPPRGWLVTANNRLAAEDYPYPLFGTWIGGHRAKRIRQLLEAQIAGIGERPDQRGFGWPDFCRIQHDTLSLRAGRCVPRILAALAGDSDSRVQAALTILREWNGDVTAESVGATIFNLFFWQWTRAVCDARFPAATAELLAKQAEGIATRLLADDPHGWFSSGERLAALRGALLRALAELRERFGEDPQQWQWGKLHPLPLKHVLSARGDLRQLLDYGGQPVKGDSITVCNTGPGPDWRGFSGAGFRLIADLNEDGLRVVDLQSQSGVPGSPHYSDQLSAWYTGEYQLLPLSRAAAEKTWVSRRQLLPAGQ